MGNGRISTKQTEILEYIKEEIISRGYPPTVRDICEAVHLKSTSSVHSHLETLEKNGYIQSFYGDETNGKRRTYYRITEEGKGYYQEKCIEWMLTRDVVQRFVEEEIVEED